MRETITSTANQRVKWLRSLAASPKERRRERSFVVEGVRLVEEALASAEPLLLLYAPDQLAATPRGQALLEQVADQRWAWAATPEVLAAAADTVTPQGVVAAVPWVELPIHRSELLLVLDRVQDPGNVGTLLRSAEATGVDAVLCSAGSADVWSPKVVRAAMGAHFRLPLRADLSWAELTPLLAPCTQVLAADATGTRAYYAVDWSAPTALIVGNEAQGLAAEARAAASELIAIPMLGATESLNASVAGSVLLFEALRQRSQKAGR